MTPWEGVTVNTTLRFERMREKHKQTKDLFPPFFSIRIVGPIALSVSIALAVLRFTVLLKTEVLEFNTQLRTKLNVIAV